MTITTEQLANALKRYFLQKDGPNTLSNSIFVEDGATVNIGTPSNPINNIYATNLVGGGDLETVLHDFDDPTVHDFTGFQSGYVLKGTGVGTVSIGQLAHSNLSSIGENDHHNRQHSILSASDHTVTGDAGKVLGLTATNTLGLLSTTSDGDTSTGTILKSGTQGDLKIRLIADAGYIAPTPFTSGFQIAESPESASKYQMNIGRIIADELIVKFFTADETRVRRGSDWLTPTFGIVARDEYNDIDEYTIPAENSSVNIWFDDSVHVTGALFTNNEWVLIEFVDYSSGLTVLEVWGQVSSYYTDGNHPDQQRWTFTNRTSGLPSINLKTGTMIMGFGTSGSGWIYRTTLSGGPRTKYVTWTGTNPRDGTQTLEVQVGDLTDVTSVFGSLSGINGLFAKDAVYIEGAKLAAAAGDFVVNEDGINIKAGTISSIDLTDFSDKITFTTTPLDPATGSPVFQMYGLRYDSGGGNYVAHGRVTAQSGGTTGNYASRLILEAEGTTNSFVQIDNGGYTPKITLSAMSGTSPQIVEVDGNLVMGVGTSAIYPSSDSTVNVGRADRYFDTLYVREIFADTYNGSITNIGTLTGNMWSGDGTDDMTINMNSASDRVLEVVNLGAGSVSMEISGTLTVYGGIVVSGTVDGVDVATLNSQYLAHSAADINNSHSGNLLWSRLSKTSSNLADLATKNHSDLDNIGANDHHNQSHVLATNTALGSDHTISGASQGQVLRANSGTTAYFAFLSHSELTGVNPNDHHDPVTVGTDLTLSGQLIGLGSNVARLNAAQNWTAVQTFNAQANFLSLVDFDSGIDVATNAVIGGNLHVGGTIIASGGSMSFTGDVNVTGSVNATVDVTADRYIIGEVGALFGTTGTPTHALEVVGTTDITGGNITLLDYWQIRNSDGEIRSINPAWSDIGDGIRLTPSGEIYAKLLSGANLVISAAVMEYASTLYSSGTQTWTQSGAAGLYADATIDLSQTSFDLQISYPSIGQIVQFAVGDTILVHGQYKSTVSSTSNPTLIPYWEAMFSPWSFGSNNNGNFGIWFTITSISESTDYYTLTVELAPKAQNINGGTFLSGSAVVGYGNATESNPGGFVTITAADQSGTPNITIASYGSEPWNAVKKVVLGNLGTTVMGSNYDYGIAIGTNLSDPEESYIYAGQNTIRIQNVEYRIIDDLGLDMLSIERETGLTVFYSSEGSTEARRITIFDRDANGPSIYLQGAYDDPTQAFEESAPGVFAPTLPDGKAKLWLLAGDMLSDPWHQSTGNEAAASIKMSRDELGGVGSSSLSLYADRIYSKSDSIVFDSSSTKFSTTQMIFDYNFAISDPGVYRSVYIDNNGFVRISSASAPAGYPNKWGFEEQYPVDHRLISNIEIIGTTKLVGAVRAPIVSTDSSSFDASILTTPDDNQVIVNDGGSSGSTISIFAQNWGRSSGLVFNGYMDYVTNEPFNNTQGNFRAHGLQTTTKAGGLEYNGNSATFKWYVNNTIITNDSRITDWTEVLRFNSAGLRFNTGFIGHSDGWQDLSLPYQWSSYDGGTTYQKPQYKRVGDLVFLRGMVKPNTNNASAGDHSSIASLPSTIWPSRYEMHLGFGYINSIRGAYRINITASGNLQVSYFGGSISTSDYMNLNGIVYSIGS